MTALPPCYGLIPAQIPIASFSRQTARRHPRQADVLPRVPAGGAAVSCCVKVWLATDDERIYRGPGP
jgi:hypothetical protein